MFATIALQVNIVAVLLAATAISGCGDRPPRATRDSPTNPADSSYAVAPADTTWPDPASHRAGYALSGGVRIHYLDVGGNGEQLILLTGLGSSVHIFDDLAPRFTDRFRVIAMTRRGHAESDHPTDGFGLDTLIADLKTVLDTLGLRRVNLAGHSIAGGELTRFAILYPDRIATLIYLDALLRPDGLEELIAEDSIRVKALRRTSQATNRPVPGSSAASTASGRRPWRPTFVSTRRRAPRPTSSSRARCAARSGGKTTPGSRLRRSCSTLWQR
jgi:pimeloyl-ACP methyl ester carboxylesterase